MNSAVTSGLYFKRDKKMKTTLIGSMPNKEPDNVIEKIFENTTIPCWPQLPKRSFYEHMCPQYSENFPAINISEENQKIYVDEEKFVYEIDKFYQNYENKEIEYFKITEKFAIGFYLFINYLTRKKDVNELKLQTTGPVTFGLTVKTTTGNPLFYNELYREVVEKHLVMKSIWQIKQVAEIITDKCTILLFYDEPYLAAYGSAFTAVSKEEIVKSLIEVVKNTKISVSQLYKDKIELKIGIHCCANTDWSILTSVESLDIISFDTYEFFDNFLLYAEDIKNFISHGGNIAWGIIPNNEKVFEESYESLKVKLEKSVERLSDKNVRFLQKQIDEFIITPQCGLGNADDKVVEQVLKICSMFGKKIQ